MAKRVLVVDDDLVYVELARELLESETISVVSAPNGAVALAMLAAEPAHMILSDIEMPVMDGITFCEQLKSTSRLNGIPFAFVSGTDKNAVIKRAQRISGGHLYSKSNLVLQLPSIVQQMMLATAGLTPQYSEEPGPAAGR